MNEEMKVLQSTISAGEYLAPNVKVKEIRGRRALCTSPGVTVSTNEGYEEESTNGWF